MPKSLQLDARHQEFDGILELCLSGYRHLDINSGQSCSCMGTEQKAQHKPARLQGQGCVQFMAAVLHKLQNALSMTRTVPS